ncbi:hypothetical protein RHS02_00923, partial [Rhizoctonia solani]
MHFATALLAFSASTLLVEATPTFGHGKDTCGHKLFWWKQKGCCLPYGGISKPPSPPAGHSCMKKWYWSSENNCCVPEKPTSPEPSCGRSLKWNPETYSCVPNGGGENCNNGDFWWDNKKCCLPHGGVPVPPSPPSGYQCPNKWYWNSDKGCCVPSVPDVPATPACPAKCSWKPESYYCAPDPAPAPPTPAPEPPKTGPDSCSKTEFWWETKKCCLPIGGPHSPPSPPGPTAHPIGTGALLVVAAFQSPSLMTTSRLRALSLALGSLKPLGANRSLLVLRRAPTANSGGQIANAVSLMVVLRARQSRHLARRAQAGGAGESHKNAASLVPRLYSSQLVDWVDSGASLRSAVSHRA